MAVLKAAYEHKFSNDDNCQAAQSPSSDLCRFRLLEVPQTPLLDKNDIVTFEDARSVFLRCVSRLEAAKKQFPLDGRTCMMTRRGGMCMSTNAVHVFVPS